MNAIKKSSFRLPILHKLETLDHKWLLNSPWLWETKVHYVLAYTITLNITILFLTFIAPGISTFIASIFSLFGFCYWIYQLWQFSIEQERGKAGRHIAQKRFGIYFLSMFLFLLPIFLSYELQYMYALAFYSDLLPVFGLTAFSACIGAVLIQIWKQIHTKLFIYTLVANSLILVSFTLIISLSSFFIVLLVALLIFGFPMLISLVSDVPKIKKFNTWKVIALASIQFYAPFLLSFVIGIFMIPFSQILSGGIFIVGIAIALFTYIKYVLPTFRQMHIHLQSLPR